MSMNCELNLTPEEQEMKEKVLRDFVRIPFTAKAAFFKDSLQNVKYAEIRDFIVAEPVFEIDAKSVVIHVPSGRWHGMNETYGVVKSLLEGYPDQDENLVRMIFGMPPL